MNTNETKDFSNLIKREVKCICQDGELWVNGESEVIGFVAAIEFNVGITIKDTITGEDIICLNKSDADAGKYEWSGKSYEELFDQIVDGIESGVYVEPRFPDILLMIRSIGNSHCAFE